MSILFSVLLLLQLLNPESPDHVADNIFRCDDGKITLQSDAPLEVIEAKSRKLKGAIDAANNTFAWSVEVSTFQGFNNPLQREHFNENYMESTDFPKATFAGKIIEQVDFAQDGTYSVRAKGRLTVHGVTQERIIKSQLTVKNRRLSILSNFSVLLADHDIRIPKIVYQKISEEMFVKVDATLELQ